MHGTINIGTSEPVTRSRLSQVWDTFQGMQASLQTLEKKLDIHIATAMLFRERTMGFEPTAFSLGS